MRSQQNLGSPPRPSSVSSSQSLQSNSSTKHIRKKGGGGWRDQNDICVGEELKIAVSTAVERFRLSEEQLCKIVHYIVIVKLVCMYS